MPSASPPKTLEVECGAITGFTFVQEIGAVSKGTRESVRLPDTPRPPGKRCRA